MKLWRSCIVMGLFLVFWGRGAFGEVQHLSFISIGGVYGNLFPETETQIVEGVKREVPVGGMSRLATIIKQEKAANPGNLFVLSAGDVMEGLLYYFFHGEAEIAGMNALGVHVATLGNHEFDLGEDILFKALEKAKFAFVVSNLESSRGHAFPKVMVQSFVATAKNGLKVGFLGLLPENLRSLTLGAKNLWVFQNTPERVREMVRHLRKEKKCQVVVLLSHRDFRRDKLLAKQVEGINLIVEGSGALSTMGVNNGFVIGPGGWQTLIVQAGQQMRYAGAVHLALQEGKNDVDNTAWQFYGLSELVSPDLSLTQVLQPFKERFEWVAATPFAVLTKNGDARKRVVRGQESALGNALADIFRWKAQSQIAFINGGGIRGDTIYPAGDISFRTLEKMFPYGNTFCLFKLTGREIKEILEVSASVLEGPEDDYNKALRPPSGGFLQLSGLRVVYDISKKPTLVDNNSVLQRLGERVRSVEVLQKDGTWSPLNEGKTYTVATLNWLGDGGDKYYVFKEHKKGEGELDTRILEVEIVAEYLREFKKLTPLLENRITIVEE